MNIRIPEENIRNVIQKAYELSHPQGLGYLHYTPGPLTDDELDGLANQIGGIRMDYIKGRAVKLTIFEDEEGHFIQDNGHWYDHGDVQWAALKQAAIGGLPE